jgi:SAM-dependent methyltransferase
VSTPGKATLEALRGEVDALRARLAAPRPVTIAPPRPEIESERLMEEIRAGLAARRLEIPELAPLPGDVPAPLSTPPVPIEYRDAYSLAELLAFHDEDFVRNAYRALMRREPEPAGLAHHLALLHGGTFAKVEILGELAGSPEARRAKVKVRGLRLASFIRRVRRVPLVGRLVGILLYVMRLPLVVRNIEQQEALLFQRERELRAAIDAANLRAMRSQSGLTVLADYVRRLDLEKAPRSIGASLGERIATLQESVETVAAGAELLASRDEVARLAEASLNASMDTQASVDAGLAAATAGIAANAEETARLGAHIATQLTRRNLEDILRRGGPDLDAFYLAFEDAFRGSREDIKGRVSVYLPYIRAAGAGTAQAPVLDFGCGRGEWLEVLKENGLVGYGLDLNHLMVAQGRGRGLEIAEGDVVEHLQSLQPGTLGAITAMHVIEHIPFERLIELFDAALRVLRPGGVAIFETPNPENLITGACNFWFDPTHIKPMPPPATQFIVRSRGFEQVEILRLHPNQGAHLEDIPNPWLRGLLLGPQDCAIVARKPGA